MIVIIIKLIKIHGFHHEENEKGMILVFILIFTAALITAGSVLLNFALREKQIALNDSRAIRAYYLAEAGVEAAYAAIEADPAFIGLIEDYLGDGTFKVSISHNGDHLRLIQASGAVDNARATITAAAEVSDSGLIIKEWIRQ